MAISLFIVLDLMVIVNMPEGDSNRAYLHVKDCRNASHIIQIYKIRVSTLCQQYKDKIARMALINRITFKYTQKII